MMFIIPQRRLHFLILGAIAFSYINHAAAFGLMQAYGAALQNDPGYRAAAYEKEAGQQFKVIGRSSLLPVLSGAYTTNHNDGDITRSSVTQHQSYRSENANVQVRQPIINFESIARYRQGVAKTSLSEAEFSLRHQDLIVRVASAYMDVKYAEDQFTLVESQLDAYAKRLLANDRLFEKGEGTKTEMLETQARFDLAEAQVMESRDSLMNVRSALAALVGDDITNLEPLLDDFRVKPMLPESFDEWKTIALEQNPEIAAQRHAVEVARQEINKQRAGHAPRIDLIAAVNKTKSDNIIFFGLDTFTRSIGVQVNVPLYAGGSVTAQTSQAVSNHEKAKAELEAKTNQVLIELRKQYSLILSSARRIDALMKTVDSGNYLLEATRKSTTFGTRTNIDILNAQQKLFEAKLDLVQARYNYLLSYLRIRRSAGTININDLQEVASYFATRT